MTLRRRAEEAARAIFDPAWSAIDDQTREKVIADTIHAESIAFARVAVAECARMGIVSRGMTQEQRIASAVEAAEGEER